MRGKTRIFNLNYRERLVQEPVQATRTFPLWNLQGYFGVLRFRMCISSEQIESISMTRAK